jgi:hypothetical protein
LSEGFENRKFLQSLPKKCGGSHPDPTKPANLSPLSSQEMRDQLNAIKALIDGLQAQIEQKPWLDDVNQAIVCGRALLVQVCHLAAITNIAQNYKCAAGEFGV